MKNIALIAVLVGLALFIAMSTSDEVSTAKALSNADEVSEMAESCFAEGPGPAEPTICT
jgi:hypothetical protein